MECFKVLISHNFMDHLKRSINSLQSANILFLILVQYKVTVYFVDENFYEILKIFVVINQKP